MDADVSTTLESLRFANREVERTAHRLARAQTHRQLMQDMQIQPATTLANHHCGVAAGEMRSALNKRSREIRNL